MVECKTQNEQIPGQKSVFLADETAAGFLDGADAEYEAIVFPFSPVQAHHARRLSPGPVLLVLSPDLETSLPQHPPLSGRVHLRRLCCVMDPAEPLP